ncbi:MAG TPA: alpha/beta hydrolase [Leptospiraceae bacterium]|nr:alpha/beta hydrolase [Leptospiraceae bacterium]HNI98758.1 alpha/beta hydrolase [Leptospiraceae bacterium]HNM06431.1 alpha/beta hydrolase [Leptospiraceae bacterium]HNN03996.1 alpha/beta hydrolase [Leptospiraceae bacterium]
MKKYALSAIALFLFIIMSVLSASVWYFSGKIVEFKTLSLSVIKEKYNPPNPEDYGLPKNPENIMIPSGDLYLSGWFFRNRIKAKKCGAVIAHGHTVNRYASLKYAPLFWKRHCHILLFDHRHHGDSAGNFGTYGFYEKDDMISSAEYLKLLTGLPDNKIALFGESYGGAASLLAVSDSDKYAFVGADSPYMDLDSIIRERAEKDYGKILLPLVPITMWTAGLRAGFNPEAVNIKKAAKKIRIPVFISHSRQDDFTPPNHSEQIFENVETEKKVLHITDWGASHTRSINEKPEEYEKQMDDFIERYVPSFL